MRAFLRLLFVTLLALGGMVRAAPIVNQSGTFDVAHTLAEAGSFDFYRTFATNAGALGVKGNVFSDHYAFVLDSAARAAGQMTSIRFRNGTGLAITGFNLREADGSLVLPGLLADAGDQTWLLGNLAPLAAGSYFLEVSGYATATSASYSGTFAAAAVPEPGSLGLVLGGVALMGMGLRLGRRRA